MVTRDIVDGLVFLPRRVIRILLLSNDAIVAGLSACASLLFVLAAQGDSLSNHLSLILTVASVGSLTSFALNLERVKLKTFNGSDVLRIALASSVLSVIWLGALALRGIAFPIGVCVVFWAFSFAGMIATRVAAASILGMLDLTGRDRMPVAIFGAGESGIQLASALKQSLEMRPVLFFHDHPPMHGLEIGGMPVYAADGLVTKIREKNIKKLFIALPEKAQKRKEEILDLCEEIGVDVQVLPTFSEMLSRPAPPSRATVTPADILGREDVDLEIPAVTKSYAGRVVLVTGAGGSIGSELCRQLLSCRPAKIILFEQSEFNLYKVTQEIETFCAQQNVELAVVLGSVTDPIRVRQVLQREKVDIILHAAAYKHVSIVEGNELEGARNNVLGTKVVADAAAELEIERFILVSTDKAVRPTNIMGATKRMAELVVQDVQSRAKVTKFSMVRFGNVLGSSGSVLPLFMSQIEAGGPVTVTHPQVCRYFMTISEAARLVLLAGAYAEGGDVFLLDMGEPQRIWDVAERLITLSGRTVKDPKTGAGDIAIKVTGLRPGEKLYEELLIDHDNIVPTPHPKILRASESSLSEIEVAGMLREIQLAIETSTPEKLRAVVMERVDGYHLRTVSLEA